MLSEAPVTKANCQIELFKRQHGQLLEPDLLVFPDPGLLRNPEVQAELYEDNFDEISYHRPERYQIRVLKAIIARIEDGILDPDQDEVSSDLVSRLASLLSNPLPPETIAAQQVSRVRYTIPSPLEQSSLLGEITVSESRSLISGSGTTGFRTWEAALRLGTYLTSAEGMELVRGQNVVELGAGTGLLSLMCAKTPEVRTVLATDGDEEVVERLKTNIVLNGLSDRDHVDAKVLRWGRALSGSDLADKQGGRPDWGVVLGADITYDAALVPLLVSTLADLFSQYPGIKAIISATLRNQETFDSFVSACKKHQFVIEEIKCSVPELERQTGYFHSTSVPIKILSITRPGPASDPFAI